MAPFDFAQGDTRDALDACFPIGESPPMPIYTYRCNACHAEFDQLVRSETTVACPECKGRRLERLMSLTARPASGGKQPDSFAKHGADLSRLGPPPGGGCCGGGCHTHSH